MPTTLDTLITRRLLLVLVLLAALVAGFLAVSRGSEDTGSLSLSASAARRHVTRFTVVERPVTDTTIDTGAPGDSVGDLLPFANPVYNAANKRQLGTDEGSCTRTRVGVAYYCDFIISLSQGAHTGRVVVAGSFLDDTAATSTLIVTGGTGDFAHAAGPMRLTTRKDGSYDFAFALTY